MPTKPSWLPDVEDDPLGGPLNCASAGRVRGKRRSDGEAPEPSPLRDKAVPTPFGRGRMAFASLLLAWRWGIVPCDVQLLLLIAVADKEPSPPQLAAHPGCEVRGNGIASGSGRLVVAVSDAVLLRAC